jgi:hypothetical protein
MLDGYFQSEKYFAEYRDAFIHATRLPWRPRNDISIHVRRGDYLQYPNKHPVVPDRYYGEAIGMATRLGFRDFHVFSDDIKWCRDYFTESRFPGVFHFSEGNDEMADMIAISNCAGGHINSSSTFSWWGAWLNRNPQKFVITPEQWFVPGHGGLDTSDIIPPTWVKL